MASPTVITFLSDVETPVSLFHKVSSDESIAFLLESTDGDSRLARYSFIGLSPRKSVLFRNGMAVVMDHLTGQEEMVTFENPLHVLQELQVQVLNPEDARPDFPFSGGWVGYMGYGATRYFDAIPQQEVDPLGVPDGYYGLYDTVLLYDHLYRRITFLSYRDEEKAKELWEDVSQRLAYNASLRPMYYNKDIPDEAIFERVTGPMSQERFCEAVRQAKSYIQEGQVFQIVVAHRFSLPLTSAPIDVYRAIQSINPSPYSYVLKFPDFVYLGSSPETFVKCHNGKVILRALAGTRPRGRTMSEDQALEAELLASAKEMAEHRMLVDLGRNDLGRVCNVGTVEVGPIATLSRYTHVMHLATELTGTLRSDKSAYDVFQSCFPRGTVSGAPKIRAMHLLAELEPERRGVYSGVVGYFDHYGNMDGAIAIRSTLIKDGFAHVHAGAGVVYDSEPLAEYEETRNKAKSILKAIQIAERIGHHVSRHSR